jgi:predicted hydrocarbon binding protein
LRDNGKIAGSKHKWQDYDKIKDQVVSLLSKHPEGMTGATIAKVIGMTEGAMSKYLSMIHVDGIITSRKVGVAKLWKVVGSSEKAEILAGKLGSNAKVTNFKDYAMSLEEKNGSLFEPDSKRVLVMPATILSSLYRYTRTILGTEVHAFFYEWGKDYANNVKEFISIVAKKTDSNFIQSFVTLMRLEGWGRFSITFMNDRSIEVVWHDSIWSEHEKENKPVDDFIAGALGAAASFSFGGKWRFSEVECKVMGANHCRFTGIRIE